MRRRRSPSPLLAPAALLLLLLLLSAWARPLRAQEADPAAPGPWSVASAEYDFGDRAAALPGFPGPVELRGAVWYPEVLEGGPFPLVLMLHGRHVTAAWGAESALLWPPPEGATAIPSHLGYEYLARHLASHGYVVVSASANGINAADEEFGVESNGMPARAELLHRHLELWRGYATNGGEPFGTRFVGRVDLRRIGTFGHSRGGEGVVAHYRLNAARGRPFGVRAIFSLAPTDFARWTVAGVPHAVMVPYLDGDLEALPGIHYFDDERYLPGAGAGPLHSVLLRGANHNYFNTVWSPSSGIAGGEDDWLRYYPEAAADPEFSSGPGSRRLTEEQQRATCLVYASAFFRAYVGGEAGLLPYLTGEAGPPPSTGTGDLLVSYHPPRGADSRLDVNRIEAPRNLHLNTLRGTARAAGGGRARFNAASPYALPLRLAAPERQPHEPGLAVLRLRWDGAGAAYSNQVPAKYRDVSRFQALQFRTGLEYTDRRRNPQGQSQDFTVELTDTRGRRAATPVSTWSRALEYPPGRLGPLPKMLLTTVRIPLSAFAGVDPARLQRIALRFDRTVRGAVQLCDLMLVGETSGSPGTSRLASIETRPLTRGRAAGTDSR